MADAVAAIIAWTGMGLWSARVCFEHLRGRRADVSDSQLAVFCVLFGIIFWPLGVVDALNAARRFVQGAWHRYRHGDEDDEDDGTFGDGEYIDLSVVPTEIADQLSDEELESFVNWFQARLDERKKGPLMDTFTEDSPKRGRTVQVLLPPTPMFAYFRKPDGDLGRVPVHMWALDDQGALYGVVLSSGRFARAPALDYFVGYGDAATAALFKGVYGAHATGVSAKDIV